MLELTNLTKPGPFGRRTIEFGNYEGIFVNDQLVAMTGQRFHCYHHIEISAVCTHPLHQGKGYAKQLLLSQLEQIIAAGSNPYLHVKTDNQRAVNVYEALGFTVRMPFLLLCDKSVYLNLITNLLCRINIKSSHHFCHILSRNVKFHYHLHFRFFVLQL